LEYLEWHGQVHGALGDYGLGNADYGALTIINGHTRLVHRKGTGPIRLEGQVVDAEFLQIGATQPTERRAAGKSNTNYLLNLKRTGVMAIGMHC